MARGRKPLPPGEALRRKRERNRQWMREWSRAHPDEKREKNRIWMQGKQVRLGLDGRQQLSLKYKKANPVGYLLNHARQRAERFGIPFDLTREDIVVPEICPVLGIKLEWGVGNRGWRNMWSPSLDKIKPELGYVRGNVMVISNRANHLKSNGSISELEAVLAYMRKVGAHVEPCHVERERIEISLPLFDGW